jgi:hypothetical protein
MDGDPRSARGVFRVRSACATTLRDSLCGPLGEARGRRVTIELDSWEAPYPQWTGRLGPLPGLLRYDLELPPSGSGAVVVRVVLAKPLPLPLIVAAALAALVPDGRLPTPVDADLASYGALPPWLPAAANVAPLVGEHPDEKVIRPYDVFLGDGTGLPDALRALAVDAWPWGIGTALVDATFANPRGYRFTDGVGGTLTVESRRWRISTPHRVVCSGPLPLRLLDGTQVAGARSVRSVTVERLPGRDAGAEAFLLAQLAMSGVVLLAERLPGSTAELLAEELVRIIAEPPPATSLEWELRSVRQRRVALRRHATGLALPATLSTLPGEVRPPSVSAVVTSAQPALLAMLAAQTYPNLEIVVARLGLSEAGAEFLAGCGRPYRIVPGETLPDFAAAARGSLVTRIDPEATYGPEHVWDLVQARHYSGATVVGKTCEFFGSTESGDVAGRGVTESGDVAGRGFMESGDVAGRGFMESGDLAGRGVTESGASAGPAIHRPAGPSECYLEALVTGGPTDVLSPGTLLVARADVATLAGWPRSPTTLAYRTHPFSFALPLTSLSVDTAAVSTGV